MTKPIIRLKLNHTNSMYLCLLKDNITTTQNNCNERIWKYMVCSYGLFILSFELWCTNAIQPGAPKSQLTHEATICILRPHMTHECYMWHTDATLDSQGHTKHTNARSDTSIKSHTR